MKVNSTFTFIIKNTIYKTNRKVYNTSKVKNVKQYTIIFKCRKAVTVLYFISIDALHTFNLSADVFSFLYPIHPPAQYRSMNPPR